MREKTVYQDSHVVLKHLPDLQACLIAWSGFPSHEKYKAVMEQAYDLIKREKLLHWVSDQTHMKTLSRENQQWVNEYFIPKILSTTSIRKVAILVGQDVFTQSAMVKIKEKLEASNLPIRYFDQFTEVENWFIAQ